MTYEMKQDKFLALSKYLTYIHYLSHIKILNFLGQERVSPFLNVKSLNRCTRTDTEMPLQISNVYLTFQASVFDNSSRS